MRLHVLSDLHLEFDSEPPAVVEDADVVVLAGDICTGADGVRWAREWAQGRPVIYLAGNHEFYGHAFPDVIASLRDVATGTSVHVLENDELVIDGVRFLGATLWSDFDFDGPDRREISMRVCARVVRDYQQIEYGPENRPLRPADTRAAHVRSREWLTERLAEPFDGPTVVVTHHQPIVTGQPPNAALRAIAGAFVSDLSPLIGAEREALWIFGHTHRSADLVHDGTRVLSNQRGYPHEPVAGFDPGMVVEI